MRQRFDQHLTSCVFEKKLNERPRFTVFGPLPAVRLPPRSVRQLRYEVLYILNPVTNRPSQANKMQLSTGRRFTNSEPPSLDCGRAYGEEFSDFMSFQKHLVCHNCLSIRVTNDSSA